VTHLLVVASEEELPRGDASWGTGGWLQPEDREALDWFTLARLSGWSAAACTTADPLGGGTRWVVVACDPGRLGAQQVDALRRRLDEPLLVVARAAPSGHPLAAVAGAARAPAGRRGTELRWLGPGPPRAWTARTPIEGALEAAGEDVSVWATLDGLPLVCARRVGSGLLATLGFHPGRARDADGSATALLRTLLVHGTPAPVAWLDLEGTLVLRMDDPGGAQNVHWDEWRYPKLGEREWGEVAGELRRRDARLSVAYTPGWVDDGDERRGRLLVDGGPAPRSPGAVWDSPRVRYEGSDTNGRGTSDYASEFRGIAALQRAGLGDVELHGHTHLHPDVAAWLRAADRHEAERWYREFGRPAAAAIAERGAGGHPLELGLAALARTFGVRPTTFVPPGDVFHDDDVETALRLGFTFVESYYLALRAGGRFCWAQHVCAPYLDLASPEWLTAGLPVVGYFHDNDLAEEGVGWLRRGLDAWTDVGVTRMIDFRELAASVALELDVTEHGGGIEVTFGAHGPAPAPPRPIPVLVKPAGGGEVVRLELPAAT
jgi:hypothetical protein